MGAVLAREADGPSEGASVGEVIAGSGDGAADKGAGEAGDAVGELVAGSGEGTGAVGDAVVAAMGPREGAGAEGDAVVVAVGPREGASEVGASVVGPREAGASEEGAAVLGESVRQRSTSHVDGQYCDAIACLYAHKSLDSNNLSSANVLVYT